jgi:hypothetical protein
VENRGLRLAAGASLVLVMSTGFLLSDKLGRDSRERMEELEKFAVSAEDVEQEVESRRSERIYDPAVFAANLEDDAKSFGVDAELIALGEGQPFFSEVDDAVVLAPGKSWSSEHLSARASIEKVQFQQHGAMVTAKHAVLQVTNTSETPIAYFLSVRSHDRGKCEVRGARMHNAMALLPDETAEIVVCAGGGKIRIGEVLVLEISDIGYRYFSQVPPVAVGHDGVTGRAHSPMQRVEMCKDIDTGGLARKVQSGLTRWVDLADYFSRHNCHRFEFPDEYRHTGKRLDRLPYVPE